MSNRNVLLVMSLVLSVAIAMAWARGAKSQAPSVGNCTTEPNARAARIGLSLDTLKEARWQRDRDIFVKRATDLGATVAVQSANGDDTVQMRDCESLIASRVDVLVIAPHDGLAMAKAVEKAKAVGIPVVAYDRLIRNADVDVYASFDNVEVGRQQAKYLVEKLGGRGRLVRIYGAPTDNNAKLYKLGQDEVLKPYVERGDIVVVHEDWAEDWKTENAKRILSAAITKGEKFAAVLASNDGTAGGAIQALEEEKLTHVLVTGQDAELPACQRIAGGSQAMTIYKPLSKLAVAAAELSVALARRQVVVANSSVDNGKRAIPALLVPTIAVDANNLMDTIIKGGFHPYDDVFRGVAEARRPPRP